MDINGLNKLVQDWYSEQEAVPEGTTVTVRIERKKAEIFVVRLDGDPNQLLEELLSWKNFREYGSRTIYANAVRSLNDGINRKLTDSNPKLLSSINVGQFLQMFPTKQDLRRIGVSEKAINIIKSMLTDCRYSWDQG